MTDLRTAAQAVSNRALASGIVTDADDEMMALRQALAEPVEPVAWQVQYSADGYTTRWSELCESAPQPETLRRWSCKYRQLYTTPPSLDALIAEIDGLGVHTFPNQSSEEFVRLKKLKGIMDKYRGVK